MKTNYGFVIILSFLLLFSWIGVSNISGNPPPPTFELKLESIRFNHDFKTVLDFPSDCHDNSVDALDIRINLDNEVRSKEWDMQYPDDPHPAVYVKQSQDKDDKKKVSIIATFKVNSADIEKGTTIRLGAQNNGNKIFGEIEFRELVFHKKFLKDESFSVEFCLDRPKIVTAFDQVWRWHWQNGEGVEQDIETSTNRIYIILNNTIKSPWEKQGTKQRWADALEIACCWANDAENQVEATAKLTQNLYDNSGGIFTRKPHYSRPRKNRIDLSKFIAALKKNSKEKCISMGKLHYVNCQDMAKALVAFANVLGCDTVYKEVYRCGKLNSVRLIGKKLNYTPKFQTHAIAAMKNGNIYQVFDATLKYCPSEQSCSFAIGDEEWTESEYKKKIFKKPASVNISKIYSFKLGIINQRASCAFKDRLEEIEDECKYRYWSPDTKKHLRLKGKEGNVRQAILNNLMDRTKTIGTLDKDEMWFKPDDEKVPKANDNEEGILDISHETYYNTRQFFKVNDKNKVIQFSVEIVEGSTMEDVKKYLLYHYASWSSRPDNITPTENFGHIGMRLMEKYAKRDNTLHIDFIRDNILIMLQADGPSKDNLKDIAEGLDKYLKDELIRERGPRSRSDDTNLKELLITNLFKPRNLYKRRRINVQVWNQRTNDSKFFRFAPSKKNEPVPYKIGDKIRIFPGFVEHCSPTGYYIEYPNSWLYGHAIKSTGSPPRQWTQREVQNNYRIIFHAPDGFPAPEPPVSIDRTPDMKTLYIWGGPPIWWVEIIPVENESAFINIVSGNVKVGEDDQDD